MAKLLFLVGLTMPFISFAQERGHGGAGVSERAAVCDVLLLLALGVTLLRGRLRLPGATVCYTFALVIALLVALGHVRSQEVMEPVTEFIALTMALLYLVVGYRVADRPELVRGLVTGVAMGVCLESVIVIHDYFLPQWFPDPLEGRVRGTFRASGQLGAYGYSAAGILFAFGYTRFDERRRQTILKYAGFLAVFCVFAASRRSAMFSILGWYVLCMMLQSTRTAVKSVSFALLAVCLLGPLGMAMYQDMDDSFLAKRLGGAVEVMFDEDNFIVDQCMQMVRRIDEWLPFGMGMGMAKTYTETGAQHEIHNGHLNMLVELGVFGFLSFYAMIWTAMRRTWSGRGLASPEKRVVAVAFLAASLAFMIHNRLHRDRGFMLFLGMASATCVAGTSTGRSSAPGVPLQRPNPNVRPASPVLQGYGGRLR